MTSTWTPGRGGRRACAGVVLTAASSYGEIAGAAMLSALSRQPRDPRRC